ncbi:hypothetical protein BEI61_04134 [Eisenbergiella tayi]|uniref:Uncharacterized protein n=2 Tax=Eisenbergiella tayi TaxID=1432052 RepID=A0A1E3A3Y8_9FIRM|nr:hypothetical protein BEI61_04134 [Eisenbergiella tayi]
MKKKSYTARLGALALALTMVTTCLTGGTMAKYVTTVSATGSATVAKFDVDIKGNSTEFKSESTANISDLFTTGWTAPAENGVKTNMLAPGVYGYFDIVVTNNSEVSVKVSDVRIESKTNNTPEGKKIRMKYAVSDVTRVNKPDIFGVEEVDLGETIENALGDSIGWDISDNKNSKTVRVWWTWENSSPSGDEEDTAIGTYGDNVPTYALTIAITAEQVISTPAP